MAVQRYRRKDGTVVMIDRLGPDHPARKKLGWLKIRHILPVSAQYTILDFLAKSAPLFEKAKKTPQGKPTLDELKLVLAAVVREHGYVYPPRSPRKKS